MGSKKIQKVENGKSRKMYRIVHPFFNNGE